MKVGRNGKGAIKGWASLEEGRRGECVDSGLPVC